MDIEDKVRKKLENCDLVLVYRESIKSRIIMMLVKTIFPGIQYNPLSPVFGYHGEVYGTEKDENLTKILLDGKFKNVCVIDENVKGNKRRVRDFLRMMREYGAFFVFVKYGLTGVSGVLINMVFFFLFFKILDFPDIPSLVLAIELSIIITFLMNNYWVFSSRVYSRSVWWRMAAYHFTLIMGIIINVGTYWILKTMGIHYMLADFVGIVLASLWNFYLTNAHVFFAKYQKQK